MINRTASITTGRGSFYIKRLCKHFNHRVEASWDERQGSVKFAMGQCLLVAEKEKLIIECQASSVPELAEVMDTVKRHFDRFARHDNLLLEWNN